MIRFIQKNSLKKLLCFCLFLFCLFTIPFFSSLLPSGWVPDFLLSENMRFRKFTEELFRSQMQADPLSLHFTIVDPEKYNLSPSTGSLGNASLNARKKAFLETAHCLKTLNTFHTEKLSDSLSLTYEILKESLTTELEGAPFLLYEEPLSPSLGIQAQLPVLLAEYTFREKKDVSAYLDLLADIPNYFSSILAFEQEKVNAGLFMSRSCASEIIHQCNDFIKQPENNYLLTIFNEKIQALSDLTDQERNAYKIKNKEILFQQVLPSYEKIAKQLNLWMKQSKNQQGLFYFPRGRDYYRQKVKQITGVTDSVEDIESAIKNQIVSDYSDMKDLTAQLPAANMQSSPISCLRTLKEKICVDFPALPAVQCQIKYVHPSLQNYLSPAFYLTSAIDDYRSNVIYINPQNKTSELDLFTTLAHEGYPGHLYQTVFFQSQNPDLIRTILSVGGYTEGWATYVEMYSYSLWENDPDLAALTQKNRSLTLGITSLLDIGIHFHGYSLEKVTAFLQHFGFSPETASQLYQNILESPANYLQYYVGYLNFCQLRDQQKEKLGEQFSLKQFHEEILSIGPAPFSVIKNHLS